MAGARWRGEDLGMRALRISIVAVSCALLAAHFVRAGGLAVAVVVAALPLLLAAPGLWARRALQVALLLGAAEWLRTLTHLVAARRALGQPSARLVVILVAVAALGVLAAALVGGRRPGARPAVVS
jgi:hypothetical protein